MDEGTPKELLASLCNEAPPLSESILDLYLCLIDAPEDLEGVLFVNEQFRQIYPLILDIVVIEKPRYFLDLNQLSLCKAVADLIAVNNERIKVAHPLTNYRHDKSNALRGNYGEYPAYSCIGVSAVNHQGSKRHMILEAYVVVSCYVIREAFANGIMQGDPSSALNKGCRVARQLLLLPRQDSLNSLPDELPGAAGLYTKHISDLGDKFGDVRHLLECAFEDKSVREYAGYIKRRRIKVYKWQSLSVNDCQDPDIDKNPDRIGIRRPISSRATANLDPEEASSGIEYLEVYASQVSPYEKKARSKKQQETKPKIYSPMEGRSSKQHLMRHHRYLHSIAMHNQRLPLVWEQLTLFETSVFLEAVYLLAENRYPITFKTHDYGMRISQIELAAYAISIFLRSKDKRSATDISYSSGEISSWLRSGYLYQESGQSRWIIYTPQLGLDQKLGNNFYSCAEHKREFFLLSSGTGLERIIDNHIAQKRYVTHSIFDKNEWLYPNSLQELLTHLNINYKTRLTIKRLEVFMFNELTRQEEGDITTAMLLTGRDDFLGTPPLHYTAISVDKLQNLFQCKCQEILDRCTAEQVSRSYDCIPTRLQQEHHVDCEQGTAGTPYRPTQKAVHALVSGLIDQTNHSAINLEGRDGIIAYHNAIMRYTAILFAFSTGFRAVTSPLLPPSQIDVDTGFAVISDKDGSDYYNARIVWLPPVCIEQCRLYFDHLEALLPKLEHLDLELFYELKALLAQDTPSEKLPLFFLLTRQGVSQKITPTDLWKDIRENLQYDLPANASRHYLRSNLLERGCPPEVISAFMGHWERGQEPWGRNSALCPINYATTLSKFIIPLLDEVGWKPIQGFQGQY